MNLTMPFYDHGAARIMVDGRQVGHVLGRYHDWVACLWRFADRHDVPAGDVVFAPTLRDLRALLRRRLENDGPWWKETE